MVNCTFIIEPEIVHLHSCLRLS